MSHQLHENKPVDSPRVKATKPFLVSMIGTGIFIFFSRWSSLDIMAKERFKEETKVMKIG